MANVFSPDVFVSSGSARILHSGCVHSYDNRLLEMQVGNLKITFIFKQEGNEPDMAISVKAEEHLEIVLKNFTSSTGVGTDAPIKLGVMQGEKLSIAFTVHSLSKDSIKQLSYTFFLGGE